jgi:hypothetical protein
MTVRDRRLVAVLCIVVLFAAAMAPLGASSPALICAILVPLSILFGAVLSAPLPAAEPVRLASSRAPAPLPSRAPPPQ